MTREQNRCALLYIQLWMKGMEKLSKRNYFFVNIYRSISSKVFYMLESHGKRSTVYGLRPTKSLLNLK